MVQSPSWRIPRALLLVLATAAVASAFGPPAYLLQWKFNVTDAHTFPSWLELAAPPAVAVDVDGSGEALMWVHHFRGCACAIARLHLLSRLAAARRTFRCGHHCVEMVPHRRRVPPYAAAACVASL